MLSSILENARHQMNGRATILEYVEEANCVTTGVFLVSQCVEEDKAKCIRRIYASVADQFLDAL